MNIAHLLLGSAQEFRDLPALARGASPHLSYRDLLAQGLGHEHAPARPLRPAAAATAWPSP